MFCDKCGNKLTEDSAFCDSCGHKMSESTVSMIGASVGKIEGKNNNKKSLIIVFSILTVVLVIAVLSDSSDSNLATTSNTTSKPVADVERPSVATSYEKISESVVNIVCPYGNEPFDIDSKGTGGSGTIMDVDGLVISNSHIIPQNKKTLNISEKGCFIILPDTTTGAPKEIYLATPTVLNDLSDKYDLAFLNIYDVYTDSNGYKFGQYPRSFPAFDDSNLCDGEQIKLGEGLKVFGYPVSSGGYNLTITEGIVSSFRDDGLILTSAKIDQGNSGGLAVDASGCMLGIPSAVSMGEYQNLGVIIPVGILANFINEAVNILNQ